MKYNPSVHAVERIRQYFGIMEDSAKNFANQLMESAKYVTTQTDGKCVYKHDGKDVMIVVDTKHSVIVTVLPPHGEGNNTKSAVAKTKVNGCNAIIEKAREVIVREIAKASRQFTKEYRELNIEQAELSVEIAQSTVKKFRCKAPHTQLIIQERIDALQRYHDVVQAKLQLVETEYESLTKEAEGYL